MKAGDKIFLKPIGNRARHGGGKIIETTVKSVARKYFTVADNYGRFHLDTMYQDRGQYASDYIAYTNKQAILDELEQVSLYKELGQFFGLWPSSRLPLEKLRKIKEIINS